METAFAYYVAGEYDAPEHRRVLPPGVSENASNRNDVLYATYSAEQTIAYYRARAVRTWPGVQAFMEYALTDDEDLIIEGYHIDPRLVEAFAAPADTDLHRNVRRVFLVRDDVGEILTSIKQGSGRNDWVLRKTQQEVTFERIARMIALYSAAIRVDAQARGFPVIAMDEDFDRQIKHASDALLS